MLILVDSTLETQVSTIEAAFQEFTERNDIAILLINQHVRFPFDPFRIKNLIDTDCGENSTHCGQIPTSVSSLARNTVEGPPLWYVLALFHSIHP